MWEEQGIDSFPVIFVQVFISDRPMLDLLQGPADVKAVGGANALFVCPHCLGHRCLGLWTSWRHSGWCCLQKLEGPDAEFGYLGRHFGDP